MKKQIVLSILLLSATLNSIYAQDWQWANSAGSIFPYDAGTSICEDQNGNIYLTGTVQGSLPGDNLHHYAYFNSDTITVNGVNDIFLTKYDSNGNQLWVKSFGGSYDNWSNQKEEIVSQVIFNSSTNSIYLTGDFIGSCSIGAYTLYATGGASDRQIFIAKFDINGNCIWAKSAGSYGDDISSALTISTTNNIYITGTVKSNAMFDTITTPNGGFLAKYNDNGNCQWVKNIFSGPLNTPIAILSGAAGVPYSIKIYNNDFFMVAGKVSDSVYVDTILFTEANYYPHILSRLDSSGNVKWAKEIGGPNAYLGNLTMDNNGNCYFSDVFANYSIIDTDTVFATGTSDFFFTKYNQNGNFQWVRQSNATLNAIAISSSSDGNGNVYLTGSFSGSAMFGAFNVTANTSEDMFIARYNTNGDCIGVSHSGQAIGYNVLTDGNGSCVVTGNFSNSMTLSSTTLVSHGYDDIFVAKIDTSINEKKQNTNNQLIIYANPNTGKCNITVPDEFSNEKNLTLRIFDNTGKLIQQTKLEMNEGKIKLNIEQETKGFYNAILSNGKKNYSGKIIFE